MELEEQEERCAPAFTLSVVLAEEAFGLTGDDCWSGGLAQSTELGRREIRRDNL